MSDITSLIADYAKAYEALDDFQKNQPQQNKSEPIIPTGDQKTGCIGEYYAMQLARKKWPTAKGFSCQFGSHSQKGWDIKVLNNEEDPKTLIQIKTISEFGKGKLSPIHQRKNNEHDWHLLWLLSLDRKLRPKLLWEFEYENIDFDGKEKLTQKTIRSPPLKYANREQLLPME